MTTLDVEKFLERWEPTIGDGCYAGTNTEDFRKDLAALLAKAKAEGMREAANILRLDQYCAPSDYREEDHNKKIEEMAVRIEKEAGDGR